MNKRPDNIVLFCCLAAGIYISYVMLNNYLFLFFLPAIAVIFFTVKRSRIYVSVFLIGMLLFVSKNYSFAMNRDLPERLTGKDILSVSGQIVSVQKLGYNSLITIETDTVRFKNNAHKSEITVSSVINTSSAVKGDNIMIAGKFRKFEPPSNKHEKDMLKYSFLNNTYGEIVNPKILSLKKNNGFGKKISVSQDYITEIFERRLSFSAGNFLTAIMIGSRDKLEKPVIKDFADSGTIHLLSVSGLHVGFLVLVLSFLSSAFNLKGWSYILLNASALLFYTVFTGASASVIRAVLMAIILMLSYPLKRKIKFTDIIGSAGIISLIYDPNQLFGAGFILTFAAVASIAVINEPVLKKFDKTFKIENRVLKNISNGLVLSFSVTIGMLPFVLYMFGSYNFLSIVSNVIVIPLTGAAFLAGIFLIISDKLDLLAQFISDSINLLVMLTYKTVAFTADMELFTLKYKTDIFITVILIGVVIIVFYMKCYKYKFLFSFILITGLCLKIYFTENNRQVNTYTFKTDDIKKGRTCLISTCGENILIAGKLSRTDINRVINPYLLAENITEIDFFVSENEWYETDKILSVMDIPVKHVVSNNDYSNLSGDFTFLNRDYIGNSLKLSSGKITFNENCGFKITSE
jgi:competence protein ComEC